MAGLDFDISKIYPPILYPVGRGTPTTSDLVGWNHSDIWEISIGTDHYGWSKYIQNLEIDLNSEKYQKYSGYSISSRIIMPVGFYLVSKLEVFDSINLRLVSLKVSVLPLAWFRRWVTVHSLYTVNVSLFASLES